MEHTSDSNTTTSVDNNNTNASTTGLRRSMFERRNRFTLRLGRRTAIPVVLALHDPKSFSEVIFQTILSLMKDKIIKYLQYDPYHGQLRVVSDLPSPHSAVVCTELQAAHHLTLLYYFTPHDPPAFVVRNTSITVLRTGPALRTALPNKESESERASSEAEQLDESDEDEHVEDDERSWHSLHARDDEEGTEDYASADVLDEVDEEYNDDGNDDDHAHEDDRDNNNNHTTNHQDHTDAANDDVHHVVSEVDDEHVLLSDDTNEHVTAQHESRDSSVHHVRGYESLRLLSHVLVLETVSSEHSLTHLLSQQSRDTAPVHHLSRYFQQSTPSKKRKSVGSDSARGRKKAKK